jgi:hypothetical protein
MPEGAFKGRLHFHIAKFGDGKIEVAMASDFSSG